MHIPQGNQLAAQHHTIGVPSGIVVTQHTSHRVGKIGHQAADSIFPLPQTTHHHPHTWRHSFQAQLVNGLTATLRKYTGHMRAEPLRSFDPADILYEDVADQLRAELEDQQVEPEFREFLSEVRKSRYIEIVNPNPR